MDTLGWETIGTLPDAVAETVYHFDLPGVGAAYVDTGRVILRAYHSSSGVGTIACAGPLCPRWRYRGDGQ